jgi:O-methyltransferase involved in polyketide biosynthesis
MEEGTSSRTAAYVALLRALGHRGLTSASGFHDEAAQRLLPSGWRHALTWLGRGIPRLPARVRARIVPHVDLLVLRALAIDAELVAAHVFEVDHPSTQSVKRRLEVGLARKSRELTHVACDFERDDLGARLEASGHRANEPTFWIWEGVTLYLDDDARDRTLSEIAARWAHPLSDLSTTVRPLEHSLSCGRAPGVSRHGPRLRAHFRAHVRRRL